MGGWARGVLAQDAEGGFDYGVVEVEFLFGVVVVVLLVLFFVLILVGFVLLILFCFLFFLFCFLLCFFLFFLFVVFFLLFFFSGLLVLVFVFVEFAAVVAVVVSGAVDAVVGWFADDLLRGDDFAGVFPGFGGVDVDGIAGRGGENAHELRWLGVFAGLFLASDDLGSDAEARDGDLGVAAVDEGGVEGAEDLGDAEQDGGGVFEGRNVEPVGYGGLVEAVEVGTRTLEILWTGWCLGSRIYPRSPKVRDRRHPHSEFGYGEIGATALLRST
jgi:energy-coupling factor transporter transmembrane protein EcfT